MNNTGLTSFRVSEMHQIMNLMCSSIVMMLGIAFSYYIGCTRINVLGISIKIMGEPNLELDSGTELERLAVKGGVFETIC